jgi:hypothetical protein
MGFVVVVAMGLYLLISFGVVMWAMNYAKTNEKNTKRWGVGAALVMFLIPFWDWLPTVAMHQYYCAKDSGFWVYKTLDQWKAENPGVMETLVPNSDGKSANGAYILNQRFSWRIKKDGPLLFSRWRWEHEVVDSKTNEILARYVDFSTGSGFIGGPPRLIKLWLQNDYCVGGALNKSKLLHFADDAENINKHGVKK